jgi:hypothetical protein
MDQRIQCPNPFCPQPDAVEKVSVVYAREADAPTSTTLGRVLSPPERPGVPLEEQDGCAPAFWLLLCFGGGVGALALAGYYYSGTPVSDGVALNVVIALALGVLLLIVGTEVLVVTKRRAVTANATFLKEGGAWQAALSKWDELSYCTRCGSVFNPGDRERFVPAVRIKDLLG